MVFDRYLITNILKKVAILYLVFLMGLYWLMLSVISIKAVSLDPAYEAGTPSPAVSYCGGTPGDGRTYCRRNCTSYVAYKLAAAGVSSAHYQHNGNGKDWRDSAIAKGIPTGSTPKVGAVAYWNSGGGGYGHVAWVDSVNTDNSVNTSNYNGLTESFYTQNSVRPEGYIYFSNVSDSGHTASVSRIAALSGTDLYVKEGAITAGWTKVATGVSKFKVSSNRVAVLQGTTLSVKEGAITAGWTTVMSGVKDFDVNDSRIAALSGTDLYVKEGAITAGWTKVMDSVTSFELSI